MQNVSSEQILDQPEHSLGSIVYPVEKQMLLVNQFIIDELRSDITLINTISRYIINNGGKRLRPVILLLAAGACNNQTKHHVPLAAIIEFIHTATLLHDDVVDASELRRGQKTANGVWGIQASVLVGDFLYSRAFQQMVRIDNMCVMDILADTTNMIAEGEVMQLINSHNADINPDDYYETIRRKTAILFQAACQLGAVISRSSTDIEQSLAEFGLNMGIAFQLIDDILDFTGDVEKTGKNIGDDLADGKVTLPMIRALEVTTNKERSFLIRTIENGANESEISNFVEIISNTDALTYTKQQALKYTKRAEKALSILPDSNHKQSLLKLTEFFIARAY